MDSILSVIRYPPITFIVARTKAVKASIVCIVPGRFVPVETIALIIVAPEIAFEPDISGVCNWEGIFDISSKPRKIDKINIKISAKMFMDKKMIKIYIFARNFIDQCNLIVMYLSIIYTYQQRIN